MEIGDWIGRLATARIAGARVAGWSIHVGESTRLRLGVKDRRAGGVHAPIGLSDSRGARYLLIWDDDRVSRGYLERGQLEQDPAEILGWARAAAYRDPDAARVAEPGPVPDLSTFDEPTAKSAGGDPGRLVQRLDAVRRVVNDAGVRTWSGSFSASVGRSHLLNSAGLDLRNEATATGWSVSLDGRIGDGFAARRPESDSEFDARLDRLVRTVGLLKRTAPPVSAGTHRVMLHPRVVESFVLGTLLDNLGGSTVAHGTGRFRREQFGSDEPVLREDLSLELDPLQPWRSGSYRFTSEGVPAGLCAYLRRGRLLSPLLDLKYSHRLGLAPTPLPLALDTVRFEGSRPLSVPEAMSRVDGGALVLSVLGTHTQDRASGDFSLSAPQALRVGPDGPVGRMRATISGNLFDVLCDPALEFARFEAEPTPGLIFPCRLDPT